MANFNHLTEAFWSEAEKEATAASPEWAERKVAALRTILCDVQLDLLDDPSRFKAVLCGRRAGKTTAFAVMILAFCLRRGDSLVAYVTMTRGVAKRNIWGMLRKLNDVYELNIKWNNTECSGVFPNGSKFFLSGADNIGEIDKLRGIPLDLVIMDEAKSFPANLFYELMDEVLRPTLADRMGHMAIGGTPGAILAGPFYDATMVQARLPEGFRNMGGDLTISRPFAERMDEKWEDKPFEWSFHGWLSSDNTAMPHLWQEQLNEKKRKGWTDDAPVWRREYLAQWVADDKGMVYSYLEERNSWEPEEGSDNDFGLPSGHEWKYVMGVDLGYDDDFAIEVGAYSETHPQFFEVYDFASPGFTISDVAKKIREVEQMFGSFDMMVGDSAGLGKAIFAELAEVHGIVVEPAKKRDKRDHIEILNSNMISGLVKIRKGSRLAWQMTYLQWDEDRKHEDKSFPNHNTDAWLYLIRHSLHTQYQDRQGPAPFGSPAWERNEERLEIEALEAAENPPLDEVIYYDEDEDNLAEITKEMRRWRMPAS